MATVHAELNNLRIAPRKVRALTNLLKGKNVNYALDQLDVMVKRSSHPLRKLMLSAIANAEHNFSMVRDNLFIQSFTVDEGVKLRRYMPRAMGRATTIHKKTSHVRLILGEKVAGMRQEKTKKEKEHTHVHADAPETETKIDKKKPEVKTDLGKKGNVVSNFGKKLFQRKAI